MSQKQKRVVVSVLAALCACSPAVAGSSSRPVVVELFTSQGCSSCPPADALLGRLSQRREVLAMSLPITYWDMLGWKDTLASDANTRRQKAYARVLGHGGVYTPQMIVEGVEDVVGSREGDVEAAIARHEARIEASAARLDVEAAMRDARLAARDAKIAARDARLATRDAKIAGRDARLMNASDLEERDNTPQSRDERNALREARKTRSAPLAVPVMVREDPNTMHIAIGGADVAGDTPATVWLYHLRGSVTVNVGAGENEGRTMTYHNVVGDLRSVGKWSGGPTTIDIPRTTLSGLPHDSVAVVVQEGSGYGQVVGATMLSHPDYAAAH
jgi:hypothetical protein